MKCKRVFLTNRNNGNKEGFVPFNDKARKEAVMELDNVKRV